ncbi:MAG: NAD-binding protein [Clostridiales bacterium]|nr:NAD-binding protein [Clostridiales bacterium]
MLARSFQPGGKISINLKDINNVMDTAHVVDTPLPLTAELLEIMTALKAWGHSEEDHCALVRYYEKLAGVEVGGKGAQKDV